MKKPAAFLLLPSALTACMPWPHINQIAPSVTGTVLRNGEPVSGALVYWHPRYPLRSEECSASKSPTTTDSSGGFLLRQERDFEMFIMMGDPIMSWTICIESNGTMYTGWRTFSMGYAPEKVRVICDLSGPIEKTYGGQGICRIDAEQGVQPDVSAAASRRQSRGLT